MSKKTRFSAARTTRVFGAVALPLLAMLLVLAPGSAAVQAQGGDYINETFAGTALNTSWTIGTSRGDNACLTAGGPIGCEPSSRGGQTGTLPDAVGALRLTNFKPSQSAFALSNTPIPAGKGVSVSFDYYAYGGTGADGITFFLIDGSATPTVGGAYGGALGYAQRLTADSQVPGIDGGYIGIGIDEFGNFANANEGRGSGCTTNYGVIGSSGRAASGFFADYITVRGAKNPNDPSGLTGYCYLTSALYNESLDFPRVPSRSGVTKRTFNITLSTANVLRVTVNGQEVISSLGLGSLPGQPPFPSTFKVGFAGSTGGDTNYHEVQNLVVRPLDPDMGISLIRNRIVAGETTLYTLRTLNETSAGVVEAADGVTVTATLDAALSLQNVSGTNWNCSTAGQTVTCTYTGAFPIPTGTTLPEITLAAQVSSGAQSVSLTAEVSSLRDGNPTNNRVVDTGSLARTLVFLPLISRR